MLNLNVTNDSYYKIGNKISSTSMFIVNYILGDTPIPCEWWLLNPVKVDIGTYIFNMYVKGKDLIERDPSLYYYLSNTLARDMKVNEDDYQDYLLNYEYEIPFRLIDDDVSYIGNGKCYYVHCCY